MRHIEPTLTIPAGATDSNVIETRWHEYTGIICPASIAGSGLTLQVSNDNVLFVPVYDEKDTQIFTWAIKSGGWGIRFDPGQHVLGFKYMRLHAGNVQASAVTFLVEMKDVYPGTGA